MNRILVVINSLGKGGAEKLLVDTLPAFQKAKPELAFTVLQITSDDSEISYIKELEDQGVSVHSLESGLYSPGVLPRLLRFIRNGNFALVHVHLFPSLYWVGLLKKMGVIRHPLVFTEHSTQNKRINNAFFRPLERFVYKAYDKIVTISPAINEKLEKWLGFKDGTIIMIRNGIDCEKINNIIPYEKTELLQSLKLSSDAKLILMTARFEYPKDHKTLIDALSFLPDNYYLLFAGNGTEMQNNIDYAQKSGNTSRVLFLDFRKDVLKLMKSVDLNVLCSHYEGMSGVTCEALATGIPFLGSDVPGINDVAQHPVFLLNNNPKDIADKIIETMQDGQGNRIMKAEAESLVTGFDINNMIGAHYQNYLDILTLNK